MEKLEQVGRERERGGLRGWRHVGAEEDAVGERASERINASVT